MNKRTHSELPWLFRGQRIRDNNGYDVASVSCNPVYIATEQEQADGAFICLAANNHERLVEMVNLLLYAANHREEVRLKAESLLNEISGGE